LSYFKDTVTYIEGNKKLRAPQIEAYAKIKSYFSENPAGEALVVLPTGTGKSGLISIAPFGVSNKRVLIITPGIVTKKSVVKTLHPLEDNFWINYDVVFSADDVPVVEEYEPDMLDTSLEKCHFVITNVQKLQITSQKSLLKRVPPDFFDMIIVDEAHHSPANTWQTALEYFKDAKKLHLTGTPYRGDFAEIPGERIHTTQLSEAMTLRLVKLLRKAAVNSCDMYFTIPGDGKRYTKDEILEYKDKEWLEKSVAM
jgi:superfamily II DNA or RNA helicase